MQNVTNTEFQSLVLESSVPVLVVFSTKWCSPCKLVTPVLDRISEENQGKVTVLKVDVEEDPELGEKFGISSVPTIIAFKNGQIIGNKLLGFQKDVALQQLVDSLQ